MADNYEVVMQEVDRRVNALIAKGLTEIDATSKVFRDDRELYQRYAQASAEAPERTAPTPRLSAAPTGAQAEVMRRGEALAKSAGVSLNDAVATVLNSDPALYARYAKGDSTPAPTFADQLLGYELEGVYPLVNALMSTLRGIAEANAGDKGAKIQAALNEFSAAVLRVAGQAGITVPAPAEKRASEFIPASTQAAIIKTAGELSPGNYVKGMRGIEVALQEIRGWAAERGAA
jgi:hypothetical protein